MSVIAQKLVVLEVFLLLSRRVNDNLLIMGLLATIMKLKKAGANSDLLVATSQIRARSRAELAPVSATQADDTGKFMMPWADSADGEVI